MKVQYCSDLHLEWGPITLAGGEVLILAGDVCEARLTLQGYNLSDKAYRLKNAFHNFFETECRKYDKVFYVMGNHEFYSSRYDNVIDKLKEVLPSNISILQNTYEEYNGVVFAGSTLWTDLNNNDAITALTVKSRMNDFRYITLKYENGYVGKFLPETMYDEHKIALEFFNKTFTENADKPCVMISHHSPSLRSIHPRYKNDHHMNGGYVSNCEHLFENHKNVKFAIHGHIHDSMNYKCADTTVLSNPRGYVGYEDTENFNPSKFFEV